MKRQFSIKINTIIVKKWPRRLLTIILLTCTLQTLFSQRRPKKNSVDFTAFLGGSYYIGDLNQVEHFNSFTKPAGGIGLRFNHNTRFSTRANILFGTIQGDDKASSSPGQKDRNLDFRSKILEYSVQGEFNFVDYKMNSDDKFFSPYTFLGIAGFQFNPKGEIDDTWYALQPLATEGQGTSAKPGSKKYKLFQISIPFGIGFKLNLSERIDLAMEWGMRKTFTDYLDDVSTVYPDMDILLNEKSPQSVAFSDKSENPNNIGRQRGNSQNKDWYSFAGIVLGFKFREPTMPCPAFE